MTSFPDVATFDGALTVPDGAHFCLLAGRFNHLIVDRLLEGAVDALRRHGVPDSNMTIVHVPGAWELPITAKRVASSGKFEAIIALGAVIRGGTPHFEHVANHATRGLGQVMIETGVIIALGVLTTDNIEQAIERAGSKAGNKGWDAATAAIEMINLHRALPADEH